MSSLVAITMLASSRPSADASVTVVAAWYERKAVVLHGIAGESVRGSEHDRYESLAERAHQHAVRLLADMTGGVL